MRILLVSNMYPSTRNPIFGTFVQRQVRGLEAAGADVRVVANDDPRTGALAAARKYVKLGTAARNAARSDAPDVVVGHFLYPTAAIARAAARAAGVPYVLVAHGSDVTSAAGSGRVARWSRDAVGGAALVVCVSRALEMRLRDELAFGPDVATAVVDMGIDTDRFHPRPEARALLGWDAAERVAIVAGNLVPVKGVDVLIEAFAILRSGDACDRLIIVGEGASRDDLRSQSEAAGLGGRVDFAGRMAAEELALHMAAADVFVLPSRQEGLGLVLAEALASGTPCVASRVGGIPEVVTGPEYGVLVAAEDPDALAAGIETVLSQGKERFSEACAARGASFDFRGRAQTFLKAIEEVVS